MDERRRSRRPYRARVWSSTAACVAVGAVLVGPLASRADAHATLVGTAPADDEVVDRVPAQVELTFDEPVEVVEGGIKVIDPSGDRADRGRVETSDDGAVLVVPIDGGGSGAGAGGQGTYTVAWRVVSEDSHNLSGTFVFHVGVRTGAAELDEGSGSLVDAVGGVGRWAAFAGAFVVVGAAALALVLSAVDSAFRRRLRRLTAAGAGLGALGVAAMLVAQAAEASGRSLVDAVGLTPDLALDTRTGVLTVYRLGVLVVAAVLALVPVTARLPVLSGTGGAVSLVLASLTGHAWTAPNRALSVPTDAVHLLAAGVWVGGLVGLVLTMRVAADRTTLVRRFSKVALASVAVVGASGTISGVVQVRYLDALFTTGYGQLLLAKVAGFLLLVALGFVNRQVLLPRIEQALGSLVLSVRGEVVVAVAVLAATAVLINQVPARDQHASGPVALTAAAADADATVELQVDPAEVGVNDLHLYFYDETGTAPLTVDAVEITAATGDLPPRRLTVTPLTPSHVSALDAPLSSPGTWTIQVVAIAAGLPATFTLEVPLR